MSTIEVERRLIVNVRKRNDINILPTVDSVAVRMRHRHSSEPKKKQKLSSTSFAICFFMRCDQYARDIQCEKV